MRITIVVTLLALSLGILGSCGSVLAEGKSASASADELINTAANPGAVDLGQSLIHPGSPLYFLKAIREKIELILDSSQEAKSMRQIEFAQRRLREIASLVKAQKQDLIPPTIEEYKVHLKLAEDATHQKTDLKVRVGEAIARHLDVLQRLYDNIGNPTAKAAIRSAIERVQDQNEKLLKDLPVEDQQKLIGKIAEREASACRFLVRESTASGLNDTEKEALKMKVSQCKTNILQNFKDHLEDLHQKRMMATPSATSH